MTRITGINIFSLEQEYLDKMKHIFVFLFFVCNFSLSQNLGLMTSDVNSRKSPAGKKLRVINKGQLVEILETKGSWSFVKDISVNKKGWVSKKFIKKNIANLISDANSRKSPGGKKLRVIKKGQLVEILETKGSWSFVKDISVNKKGWVSNSLLNKNISIASNGENNKVDELNNGKKRPTNNSNNTNNSSTNPETIIESRLKSMGILWKWKNFNKTKLKRISMTKNQRKFFVDEVLSWKGVNYKYGGTNRNGIDCSGLIWRGLRQAIDYNGEKLNAQGWAQSGKLIANKSSLIAGDLVCFSNIPGGSNRLVQHVAIYLGNGQFWHAPSSGKKVSLAKLDNPYWKPKFIFGVRY